MIECYFKFDDLVTHICSSPDHQIIVIFITSSCTQKWILQSKLACVVKMETTKMSLELLLLEFGINISNTFLEIKYISVVGILQLMICNIVHSSLHKSCFWHADPWHHEAMFVLLFCNSSIMLGQFRNLLLIAKSPQADHHVFLFKENEYYMRDRCSSWNLGYSCCALADASLVRKSEDPRDHAHWASFLVPH
jgi:hypothetical protein